MKDSSSNEGLLFQLNEGLLFQLKALKKSALSPADDNR
jgi:hypothetical protein